MLSCCAELLGRVGRAWAPLLLGLARAGSQQVPVLPTLGLLAMPSDPALAPLQRHLCPTCSQALPIGSSCLPTQWMIHSEEVWPGWCHCPHLPGCYPALPGNPCEAG